MAHKKPWKILDRGMVPMDGFTSVQFTCLGCGNEALLEVFGIPMAQLHQGIVFDIGPHAMPSRIQCRKCRRTFGWEAD